MVYECVVNKDIPDVAMQFHYSQPKQRRVEAGCGVGGVAVVVVVVVAIVAAQTRSSCSSRVSRAGCDQRHLCRQTYKVTFLAVKG